MYSSKGQFVRPSASGRMWKIVVLVVVALCHSEATVLFGGNQALAPFVDVTGGLSPLSYAGEGPGWRKRCPLCDSSVYSYCSEKLFHDSCCCHNSNNPYDRLPRQCQYADCSFLHANTCQEHKLITSCCCTNYLK